MATLFHNFSFDRPSPSLVDHEAERALMNCSPTSMPATPTPCNRPPTPPPCTMADLALILDGQRLFVGPALAAPSTPPADADTFPTEQLYQHPRPTYCRASASIMRMQRQANSRLQCCSSQARDISKLVRMIQQEDQCSVSESSAAPAPVTVQGGDDEAIDMDYDCPLRVAEPLYYSRPMHRAGDRPNDSARVSKSVRMRKRSSTAKDTKERRATG